MDHMGSIDFNGFFVISKLKMDDLRNSVNMQE